MGDDAICVRAREAYRAGFDGFGTFGFFAHDDYRFAERGAFFLDAARIGEEDCGAAHEIDEGDVSLGIDQVDGGDVFEMAMDGIAHVGIAVDGVDDFDIGAIRQLAQGAADVFEAFAEAFAAVGGDDDEMLFRIEKSPVAAAEFA